MIDLIGYDISIYQVFHFIDEQVKPVLRKVQNLLRKIGKNEVSDNNRFKYDPKADNEKTGDTTPQGCEHSIVRRSGMEAFNALFGM